MSSRQTSSKQNSSTVFTMYGRNAIYLSLKAIMQSTAKRGILVPAYACGDELEAVKRAGMKMTLYDVSTTTFQVSLKEIKKRCSDKVGAILVTHYFGFPQKEIAQIKRFCRGHDIFLLEDCAHVMWPQSGNQALGSFGDVSIFSLRKFYPIPHGGVLVVNNEKLEIQKPKYPSSGAVRFDRAVYRAQQDGRFPEGVGIKEIYAYFGRRISDTGERLKEYGGYTLGISKAAREALRGQDSLAVAAVRRKRFKTYLRMFNGGHPGRKMTPVYSSLPTGVVPFFFPIFTKEDSEVVWKRLIKKGVKSTRPFWNHGTRLLSVRKTKSQRLKRHVLVLPLSHDITDIERKTIYEAPI